MNLLNLAKGGLSSAQNALQVTGNNINNSITPGYSRRTTVFGEAGGMATPQGFYGYGVRVEGVLRNADPYINNQLRSATTRFMAFNSRLEGLTDIDNMLGDVENNPSAGLNNFFDALKKMESDPSAPAARQAAFDTLGSLSWQFNKSSERLDGLLKSTNNQIERSVAEINSSSIQLAKMNQQIEKISAQNGTPPADLLDARDNLLNGLSMQLGIRVSDDNGSGRINVQLADGRPLVVGDRAYPLSTSPSPSPADAGRIVVSYTDASGNAVPVDEQKMVGGKLGGLFAFRNDDLSEAQNALNQMALKMAGRFNEVNANGFDRYGNPGGDLFTLTSPPVLANHNNHGDGHLTAALSAPYSEVQAQDYSITRTASGWEVRQADGSTVPHQLNAAGELEFAGVTLTVSGAAAAGDSFMLNPAAGAAGHIGVAIANGDGIAASDSSDPAEIKNNENLLALAGIRNEKLLGKATLTEAYASLASATGSKVSALKADHATTGSIMKEISGKWQSVAGVSLEEEHMNLQLFTQYYQANAQILRTATTLFDTLLAIK